MSSNDCRAVFISTGARLYNAFCLPLSISARLLKQIVRLGA